MGRATTTAWVCAAATVGAAACLSRPVTSTEPHTSNLNVERIRNDVIDKVDLLFVIDNSQSMGDKQALLAKAVPQLVNRLIVPRCVNAQGVTLPRTRVEQACPDGFVPEFRAATDIHIGVITSSLGGHGATNSPCPSTPPNDDRGLLLPKVRPERKLADYAGTGFLAWDPGQKLSPPGELDSQQLGARFGEMVQAAGESGCGYEATLEAWYRFLIDPEPPLSISVDQQRSVASGIDSELLAERRAFLRPDSLVAIVMLTDENDCSIRDDAYGNRLANQKLTMSRATSICETDPNAACCLPCEIDGPPPTGCSPPSSDPACQASPKLGSREDQLNLRCLRNKQRFGYDFLYPTSRYVDALTKLRIVRRSDGQLVDNPLFVSEPGRPPREQSSIYLAGIVGVPWQDIADDASLKGPGLRYLSPAELSTRARWDVIVGDSSSNRPPLDPFMHESTEPRSGQNPITGDLIGPPTSSDPRQNAINGHEQVDVDDTDLQYACTFELASPAACTSDGTCDCHAGDAKAGDDLARNRPLCQPPAGGPAEPKQYFGKAYPGLRTLEVLKGIGDSAIVASICPKVLKETEAGYGYEPAVDAIVDRFKTVLSARCLPRPLAVEPGDSGELPCVVVEAAPPTSAAASSCSCDATKRRRPASNAAQDVVRRQLAELRQCGTDSTPDCSTFCLCELEQAEGSALDECLNSEAGSQTEGYCYVNPFGTPAKGNPDLVAGCTAGTKQLIRFVGPDTPRPGATTFLGCLGATSRDPALAN
jgi:hypothetical protein